MQNRLPVLWSSRRSLALTLMGRLASLVERLRDRWKVHDTGLRGQAQRFGAQAWRRVTTRWPSLEQLVEPPQKRVESLPPTPLTPSTPPQSAVFPAKSSTDSLAALLAELRDPNSWQTRARAAASLAEVRGPQVVNALLDALRDPSAEVAVAVVDALTAQREPRALAAVKNVLGNPDGYFSPITRVAALSGLAEVLPITEFDTIFEALRDVDAEVSIAAIAMVTEHLPGHASEHLLAIVRNEFGFYLPVVRLAAVSALERAGTLDRSLAAELLRYENDPQVSEVLAGLAGAERASA